MKLKILFITFSVILFSNNLLSQVITVVDNSSLVPIEQVLIGVKNQFTYFYTDSKGQANIESIKEVDVLTFSHVSFHPIEKTKEEIMKKGGKVGMTERSLFMEEVVISSSKFEEKKKEVAQNIEIIKSKDIAFANQYNTADVLANTGNIFVQKSQMGGGSPVLRGLEANKILLVVDGVRMNNAICRGGHLQNIMTVDNNILDKVEIVFGPGSVVYGSDALGGVIHLQTKNPVLSKDSSIVYKSNGIVRHSTANSEKTFHIDGNIGGRKIASLTSFTYSDFSHLRAGSVPNPFYKSMWKNNIYSTSVAGRDSFLMNTNAFIQKPSAYSQYDLLQKIVYTPNTRSSHLINLQYSNSTNVPRYDRMTEIDTIGNPRFAEWYYGPQKRIFASYNYTFAKNTLFFDHAKAIFGFQYLNESRHTRRFQAVGLTSRMEKVFLYTLNIDFNKIIKQHEIRYGIEANSNYVASVANFRNINTGTTTAADTRYPDGGSYLQTAAAYFTHNWEVTPKIVFSNGIRYSYNNLRSRFVDTSFFHFPFTSAKQQSSAINGSLGLIYFVDKSFRVAAIASSGFRVPNVDDLGKVFESVTGSVIIPNPNLKPEYSYNAELTLTKMVGENLEINVSGFYNYLTNVIVTKKYIFSGQDSILYDGQKSEVLANQNANKAFTAGGHISLVGDLTPHFSIIQTANFTYGKILTDSVNTPLDHIPPFYGKTSFLFSFKNIKSEVFFLYNGWKRVKNYNLIGEDNFKYATPEGMPAWYTFNYRLAYHPNKNFTLQFSVENIFDYHYRVFASGISAPGRNFIFSVRTAF